MKKIFYLVILVEIFSVKVYGQEWEWARKAMVTSGHQTAKDVCFDDKDNVFVLGYNYTQTQFDKQTSVERGPFVASYDKGGNFLWVRLLDGDPVGIDCDIY